MLMLNLFTRFTHLFSRLHFCAGGQCATLERGPHLDDGSGVRDHAGHLRVVGIRNQRDCTKLPLGLGFLRRKDVAHLGLATLDLAGASLLEAL